MKRIFWALAAVLSLGTAAQAAEVSFSSTVTEQFDPVVSLPGFDPALGTLTGASLEYDLRYINGLSFNYVCEGGATCDETWTFTSTASVNAFGNLLGFGSNSGGFACTIEPGEFCGGSGSVTVDVEGSVALDLFDVLGVATFDVSAFTPAPTVPGGIPDFFDVFPSAELSASVTYTFDEAVIPLPMPALLLLTGFGGIALATRRRR